MKKQLRYLVNTILFIVIWWVLATIFFAIVINYTGVRPSGFVVIAAIVAFFISYFIVKRINKSNLWSSLFDEKEIVNDFSSESKDVTTRELNRENPRANNIFEEEVPQESAKNFNSKTSNPVKKSKVYVYARNKKTNKPARFTQKEWESTVQHGDVSLFDVLYDYNEKDYLKEINDNDQSIEKSKQSLINLKKKGFLSEEEYQQKLNSLNQNEYDVHASINDFISNFEKNISGDLLDLKNLYDSKVLSSEEYLKKTHEIKLKSIGICMKEKGINVQLKEERLNLKSFDNIRIESDDKIITKTLIGKLKEPRVIKGESKLGLFISLKISKGKPIIVCYCNGEFVEWDPSKCILNRKPVGLYGMEGGGITSEKIKPNDDEMKKINSKISNYYKPYL